MKNVAMIVLGAALLAACAPMNTSNTSSLNASTSGTSSVGNSTASTSTRAASDDAKAPGGTSATTGTSTVAISLPTVAVSAPVVTGTGSQSKSNIPMTRQASAPAGVNPTGTLDIKATEGQVATTATVSGLAPNTYYVAHYHLQGTKSADPCTSDGAPIMASMIVGRSDGTGSLTLKGNIDANTIKSATYFNIHTAKDLSGAPADAGVICTPVS